MNSGTLVQINTDSPFRSLMQDKGQVTIPIEVRKRWNLQRGDLIAFAETDEGLILYPQTLKTETGEIIAKKNAAPRKAQERKEETVEESKEGIITHGAA